MILTPRQTEIARLLALGRRPKQIAQELGVSGHTVNKHMTQAGKRLEGLIRGTTTIRLAKFWLRHERGDPYGDDDQLDAPIVRPDTESGSFVYFIASADREMVKIGVTTDPDKRFAALRLSSPTPLELLGVISDRGEKFEQDLHVRFREHRSHGEWFRLCPEINAFIESEAETYLNDGRAGRAA